MQHLEQVKVYLYLKTGITCATFNLANLVSTDFFANISYLNILYIFLL